MYFVDKTIVGLILLVPTSREKFQSGRCQIWGWNHSTICIDVTYNMYYCICDVNDHLKGTKWNILWEPYTPPRAQPNRPSNTHKIHTLHLMEISEREKKSSVWRPLAVFFPILGDSIFCRGILAGIKCQRRAPLKFGPGNLAGKSVAHRVTWTGYLYAYF